MAPKSSRSSLSAQVNAAHAEVVRSNASTSTSAVSTHAQARLGLISGLVEATLVIMELIFGLNLVQHAIRAIYRTFNRLSADEEPPVWNAFCMHVASNLIVIYWLVFRLSQKHQPVVSVRRMAECLSLWPQPRAMSRDSLRVIGTVFTCHFIGTAGLFAAQHLTGNWIFGWDNYFPNPEKGFNFNSAADMLLLAPIREELTFRGLVFAIFYLRGAAFKLASSSSPNSASSGALQESLAWSSAWKLEAVLATSAAFGLVHLLNLFGSTYTTTYIILQVVLGMTLGAFFCLRFVLSENSLMETIILHMINNAFSSCLPTNNPIALENPMFSIPLSITFIVYGTLVYQQVKKLLALPSQPFKVLLSDANDTDIPPATAAAVATSNNESKEQ